MLEVVSRDGWEPGVLVALVARGSWEPAVLACSIRNMLC